MGPRRGSYRLWLSEKGDSHSGSHVLEWEPRIGTMRSMLDHIAKAPNLR